MRFYSGCMLIGLSILTGATALAAEKGVTRYSVHLRAEPYTDAKTLTSLKKNTALEVIKRRGAWINIKVDQLNGWLRMHQVRLGDGKRKKKSGFFGLSYLWSVHQTGRSGARGMTATTGIRGLDAKELKDAKPDKAAVEKLETIAATADTARSFAGKNNLKEMNVPYLPEKGESKSSDSFSEDE